jgi:hypothetical protein
MSLILKSGSSGILADVVNVGGVNGLVVSVAGSLAAGSNLIGQVEITDGVNVLGTLANPVVTSQAPPSDIIVTGTIASSPTANVAIDTQGAGVVLIFISDSWSGTLQFEASPDGGTTWRPAVAFPKPSTTTSVSSTIANGVWAFPVGGASMFRVRASAWSTGSATVRLEASQSTQIVQAYNLYPQNLLTYSTCIGTLTDDTTDAETYPSNVAVLTTHASAFNLTHREDMLTHLSSDLSGNLRVRQHSESVLGDVVVVPRLNQVEINFSEGFNPDTIINASSGSGSTLTATGAAEWHTGTSITGAASGTTTQQLQYHPGHEWFAKFTAAFTAPTDSFNPNHQRIGPFNTTDGFYIGYEKTTFGLTQLQGSTPFFIPRSSWNGDPADGSANSVYTRLGVPDVLEFTNINIYRMRGSWFGTAPVQLQVFSPDFDWVTLHTFHFPNTIALPYTYTTNWNMTVDVSKSGSDSTDLRTRCACLVLGTNNDTASINDPLTDYAQAKLVRAVLTGKNTQSGVYDNVGLSAENAVTVSGSGAATIDTAVWDSTTPQDTFVMPLHNDFHHNTVTIAIVSTAPIDTGAITFEASIDDIHYLGITGVDVGTGLSMPSSVVNIVGGTTKIYTFNVSGFDHFRYRLSTQIGQLSPPLPSGTVTSSYLLQGLSSPSISTTINTGAISVASNQGTPNTLGNAWPMELTDGTHGPVAVKGPSTPAVVTDNALVVAISPINSVAVTGTFFPATQPVSGTVAVTQSTSPWITQDSRFVRTVAQDGSGNVGVNVQNFPASQTVSGGVTAQILDSGGVNKATVDSDGQLFVDLPDVEFLQNTTSPPTAVLLVGGKSADVTPVYNPIPLAAGSGSVIVSGTVAVTQSTSPWVVQVGATGVFSHALNQDGSGNVGVKGADGDVFVRQTAAANLNATVVGTGTFVVQATLAAETTKVIGVVRNSDGAGNLLTSNSTATAGKFGLDANILSILGTAPTTAGKLDVKGADGDVFVRQATAANLNATVIGNLTNNNAAPAATNIGALTALANAANPSFTEGDQTLLSVNLTGGMRIAGTKTNNSAAPTSELGVIPAVANAVAPAVTEGNQVLLSTDLTSNVRTVHRPASPVTANWSHAIINVAAATGTQTLIALSGTTTIRVMKVQFTTDKATDFNFLDSTPTALSGVYKLTGNGSSFADSGDGEPLWVGAAGKAFQISLTQTVTLGGDIWFTQT